jgi:hypothetical protein
MHTRRSRIPTVAAAAARGPRGSRSALAGPAALLALAWPASALAQPDPTFQKGNAADVKDVQAVEWTAKGEAGLVATTGNARTTTITAGASAVRKDKDNKLEATVAGAYARAATRAAADGNGNGTIEATELSTTEATSAETVAAKLRYDRYLTAAGSLYVAALGAIDRPAGKDFEGGGQLGYSRSLFKDERHEALGEVGYDLSYLSLADGDSTTVHSARVFAGYKGKLTKDTAVEGSIEALANLNTLSFGGREASALDDTRLTAVAAVTTSLSTKLSLSASLTAKYDRFPAPLGKVGSLPFAAGFVPLADELDTITKISLIVKFL